MRTLLVALVALVALAAMVAHGDNSQYDVNNDGVVNALDLSLVAQHFGPVIPDTPTPAPTAIPTNTPSACWPNAVPVGAVAGNPAPVFCSISGIAPNTFTQGANSWSDSFNQPLSLTGLSLAYKQDSFGDFYKAIQWQHSNHWMVDFAGSDQDGPGPWDVGGVTMRPDRSFRFEPRTWTSNHWGIANKTEPMMVIETDYAAGVVDYLGEAWGELVITTSPTLSTDCTDTGCLYAYDHFPSTGATTNATVGCRMDRGGFTCAHFAAGEARTWEISSFQNVGPLDQCGTFSQGTTPFTIASNCGQGVGMRLCYSTNPDIDCRDHIRWEISATRSAVYVNGILMDEHDLSESPLSSLLLNSDVYVYLGSVESKRGADTIRWHWDQLNILP